MPIVKTVIGTDEKHSFEANLHVFRSFLEVYVDQREVLRTVYWGLGLDRPKALEVGENEKHNVEIKLGALGGLTVLVDGRPPIQTTQSLHDAGLAAGIDYGADSENATKTKTQKTNEPESDDVPEKADEPEVQKNTASKETQKNNNSKSRTSISTDKDSEIRTSVDEEEDSESDSLDEESRSSSSTEANESPVGGHHYGPQAEDVTGPVHEKSSKEKGVVNKNKGKGKSVSEAAEDLTEKTTEKMENNQDSSNLESPT